MTFFLSLPMREALERAERRIQEALVAMQQADRFEPEYKYERRQTIKSLELALAYVQHMFKAPPRPVDEPDE